MKKVRDHYFNKAKQEGFPARSVYKLKEAQRRFKLLSSGMKVLDLGASPGSWTKFAASVVGRNGKVIAIDLHPLKVDLPNVTRLTADCREISPNEILEKYGYFDCVLSDMAPKTTGRKDVDHYRSVELATTALEIAKVVLKEKGCLFLKIFQGADFAAFRKECMAAFKKVRVFKPKSSRPESVEIFIHMEGLKHE